MTGPTTKLSPLILSALLYCIPCGIAAQDNQPQEFVLDHWTAQLAGPEVHLVSIPLKQRFSGDADMALQEIGPVAGFGISGTLTIHNQATGLIRVVMVTENGQEYLVLEAYSLTLDAAAVSFRNACEETCVLTGIIPRRLRVEVVDATLETTSIAFSATGPGGPATRLAAPSVTDQAATGDDVVRDQQVAARVKKLNESIAARRLRWVAGDTPIARLTYAEKRALFGGGGVPNLQGFEYYVGGIFDIGGIAAPTDAGLSQSAYVDEFDWRSRHGANEPSSPYFDGDSTGSGWITSVKRQKCGDCWAHCAVGAVEAQANLYFNQHVDLDLSEQEMVSCDGGSCRGGNPWSALTYIRDNGIVEETCFPSSGTDESCANRCSNPSELIRIGGFHGYGRDSEDTIKAQLINFGPTTFGIDSWWHCLVAVGYRRDPLDGGTIWILKNSWGAGWGEYGYGYIRVPLDDVYLKEAIDSPVLSINVPRDIACNDLDGDGYFNWGIASGPPGSCPADAPPERDCDDRDPTRGPFEADWSCPSHRIGVTELVSVASDGTQSNNDSFETSISLDGRYVSFHSGANNLVPEGSEHPPAIYVRDRYTGRVVRANVASDGTEANQSTYYQSISGDGRYVVFSTSADNLVPGDTNRNDDVFVHDLETGMTERISISSDGTGADLASYTGSTSLHGRYVAFDSEATNLVPNDTNGTWDIFVHDRDTGVCERVSVSSDGSQANGASVLPDISVDGRYVAFSSTATNLVSENVDVPRLFSAFIHDRRTGTTERVSYALDGDPAGGGSPSVSADGRFVAFESDDGDIFVYDRRLGTTELVSVAWDGSQANEGSRLPAISANGQTVAFTSFATNLVPNRNRSNTSNIFVRDLLKGTTELVSVALDGGGGNCDSPGCGGDGYAAISGDGRYVSFASYSTNLVPDDTNGERDVFVRDRFLNLDEYVEIEVRPGQPLKAVNPRYGLIPVAILSTSKADGEVRNFDALQINPDSVRLGPDGAAAGTGSRNRKTYDVDGDGDVDLWLRFPARNTGIECGDTDIALQGETYSAKPVMGEDSIRTIFCK